MIVNLLVNFVLLLLGILFVFFPKVYLSDIPLVGDTITSVLATIGGTWAMALDTVPYLELPWNVFLYVIIPFEILLLVMRFFLGNRVPVNDK